MHQCFPRPFDRLTSCNDSIPVVTRTQLYDYARTHTRTHARVSLQCELAVMHELAIVSRNCKMVPARIFARQGSLLLITSVPAVLYPRHIPLNTPLCPPLCISVVRVENGHGYRCLFLLLLSSAFSHYILYHWK